MKKVLGVILAVTVVISTFAVGVLASDNVKEIAATINYALKMKVDNIEWNPTEADGSAIRPITYNGRTYLPVRALAEKLGIAIDWDEATQTVLIGEKDWRPLTAKEVDFFVEHTGFTKDADKLYIGDGACDFGVALNSDTNYDKIKIDGSYTKMKLTAYCSDKDVTVRILDDETDQTYKEIALKKGVKTDVEFNIDGAKTLQVRLNSDSVITKANVVLGNIYLK